MPDDKKDSNQGVIAAATIGAIAAILAAIIGAYAVLVAAHVLPFPFSTSTPTTTPIPDPEEFVRSYFNELWQTRNYDFMWNNDLTPKFQAAAAPTLQGYIQNFDKIQKIDINSVNITERQSDTSVSVAVNLTFYYKNGTISANNPIPYDLTYNSTLGTWQFDIH